MELVDGLSTANAVVYPGELSTGIPMLTPDVSSGTEVSNVGRPAAVCWKTRVPFTITMPGLQTAPESVVGHAGSLNRAYPVESVSLAPELSRNTAPRPGIEPSYVQDRALPGVKVTSSRWPDGSRNSRRNAAARSD